MGVVGACSIAISLFWIGWTSSSSVSVWAPITGGLPLGIGVTLIFVSRVCHEFMMIICFAKELIGSPRNFG
jgi:hypothetical protein